MKHDPEIVNRILVQLRQWGWETGLKKLQAEIAAAADENQRETLRFFAGWIAAERGAHGEAADFFQQCGEVPALAGWALFGQAFLAHRQHDASRAHPLLKECESHAVTNDDRILEAAVHHLRGAVLFHEGQDDGALHCLHRALAGFGKDHFGTGRVLDTFGMVYAHRDNFHAAEEFYIQARKCKERCADQPDQPGLAVTYGNLGRLYLDWGYLDKAELFFEQNRKLSQNIMDEYGEVQMHNELARVLLERAASAGRPADAAGFLRDASGWLEQATERAHAQDWPVLEAFARKDQALVLLAENRFVEAETQARTAEDIFRAKQHAEGIAQVNRVWGIWLRQQGKPQDAFRPLRATLAHYQKSGEHGEVARTQLEIARCVRDAGKPVPQVRQEYVEALAKAETSRRWELVQRAEEELRVADPEAYWNRLYRRVRGNLDESTSSLVTGERKTITVLYLDLKDSTEYARGHDPEEIMMLLNQMMADFVAVLRKHDARVSSFRGDGFLALFLERNHAVRAVAAALELFGELQGFNEPRNVLGLKPFEARIGIATGEVFLGNVGTYEKMDYTALGTPANLGARLEAVAEPGLPCISRQTYEAVGNRFTYKEGSPRRKKLAGLEEQEMWDVTGVVRGAP